MSNGPLSAQICALELARERHAASPQHRPVRHERRPLDGAVVGQFGGFGRLEHAQGAARQLDRLLDELILHGGGL
jgi:hypothetical protein